MLGIFKISSRLVEMLRSIPTEGEDFQSLQDLAKLKEEL